ncbi:hypothetical protein [Niveispirillum sp. KHB5.9]|uniref:hypothetical protein n=1 Tax=Niveispirillum sp. KHB5.9 TaxID=3400269 RepID=UPI003A88B681
MSGLSLGRKRPIRASSTTCCDAQYGADGLPWQAQNSPLVGLLPFPVPPVDSFMDIHEKSRQTAVPRRSMDKPFQMNMNWRSSTGWPPPPLAATQHQPCDDIQGGLRHPHDYVVLVPASPVPKMPVTLAGIKFIFDLIQIMNRISDRDMT